MQPTFRQRFFASDAVFFWMSAVAGAIYVAWHVVPITEPSLLSVLRTVLLVFLGGVLGFFLTVFPGMFVLNPIMNAVAWANGSPFHVGDEVMILCGKHAGRVTRVYELWQERRQLRVELGESERAALTDVYFETQVSRQRPLE